MRDTRGRPTLAIAFPKSETELRVVFSEPMDQARAEDAASYRTASGLGIRGAKVDPGDLVRVTLVTDEMNGEAMVVDVLHAPGVVTGSGGRLAHAESPEFIQGIASIPELQKPVEERLPFTSRFVGKVASASCGKDGGVDSNVLIDTFGFAFIHMEGGGPFNSLKIVTKNHIPGIANATQGLPRGQTVHVLWAGGEVRNVAGETQLTDTGYMEGSIIPPNPLKSPQPFRLTTAELSGEHARSLRAKGFQGVVALFEGVVIDEVERRGEAGMRAIRFHDASGGSLRGVVLANVQVALQPGQRFHSLRGLVHQPRAGEYEAIVELDDHFDYGATKATAE